MIPYSGAICGLLGERLHTLQPARKTPSPNLLLVLITHPESACGGGTWGASCVGGRLAAAIRMLQMLHLILGSKEMLLAVFYSSCCR